MLRYPKPPAFGISQSCLSCLSSLTGGEQDSSYESHCVPSSLFVQHNTTVKKQEGQRNEGDNSWLLYSSTDFLKNIYIADRYNSYALTKTKLIVLWNQFQCGLL